MAKKKNQSGTSTVRTKNSLNPCTSTGTAHPKNQRSDDDQARTRESINEYRSLLDQISLTDVVIPGLSVNERAEQQKAVSGLDPIVQVAVLLDLCAYVVNGKIKKSRSSLLKKFVTLAHMGTYKFHYGVPVAESIVSERKRKYAEAMSKQVIAGVPTDTSKNELVKRISSIHNRKHAKSEK